MQHTSIIHLFKQQNYRMMVIPADLYVTFNTYTCMLTASIRSVSLLNMYKVTTKRTYLPIYITHINNKACQLNEMLDLC